MNQAKAISLLTRAWEEISTLPSLTDLDSPAGLAAYRDRIKTGRVARQALGREIHRFINAKANQPEGENLKAAREWLKNRGDANPALRMALLTIAKAVDESPGNANLWRQYLDAAKALQQPAATEDSEADDFETVMAALRA
jgi:hypothetical protein